MTIGLMLSITRAIASALALARSFSRSASETRDQPAPLIAQIRYSLGGRGGNLGTVIGPTGRRAERDHQESSRQETMMDRSPTHQNVLNLPTYRRIAHQARVLPHSVRQPRQAGVSVDGL